MPTIRVNEHRTVEVPLDAHVVYSYGCVIRRTRRRSLIERVRLGWAPAVETTQEPTVLVLAGGNELPYPPPVGVHAGAQWDPVVVAHPAYRGAIEAALAGQNRIEEGGACS